VPNHHASQQPFAAADLQPLDKSNAQLPETKLRPLSADEFFGRTDLPRAARTLNPITAKDFDAGMKLPSDENSMHELGADDFVPGARSKPTDMHARLTAQAQKWVAQTFYGTLLKQMHDSPFKSDLFDGGRGGQAFGTLRDQQLADRMSRGAGNKLVRSIVKKIEANVAYRKQQTTAGATPADAAPRDRRDSNNQPGPGNQGRYKDVKIHVAPALRA
jgi:Rod binding domain-containing protein